MNCIHYLYPGLRSLKGREGPDKEIQKEEGFHRNGIPTKNARNKTMVRQRSDPGRMRSGAGKWDRGGAMSVREGCGQG